MQVFIIKIFKLYFLGFGLIGNFWNILIKFIPEKKMIFWDLDKKPSEDDDDDYRKN